MKILISAAEASSDAHGAELLKALRKQLPSSEPLEAFGIGGPKLSSQGLRTVVDARELLAMGFGEIFGRLPRIFRALRELSDEAAQERPDIAVFIDYPDFHFRLARRLKLLGIPMIYYIPPKVWVWRKKRVEFLRKFFVKILCILPFEEKFYQEHQVAAKYVGNPLIDELPLNLTQAEARTKLSLAPHDPVVVLMPGSRPSELKRHLELMLDAVKRAAEMFQGKGRMKVLLPFPVTADLSALRAQIELWSQRQPKDLGLDLVISQGNAAECLVAADCGLIKSGTSTLEAGLLRCPHAVIYKPSQTTTWIFRYLIRYRGPVGLVNLVSGWKPGQAYLVPEILCEKVTKENLAAEIVKLFSDSTYREKMRKNLEELRDQVCGKSETLSPSRSAALEVIQLVKSLKKDS
jgi:lipid-A-disaccharide synthase